MHVGSIECKGYWTFACFRRNSNKNFQRNWTWYEKFYNTTGENKNIKNVLLKKKKYKIEYYNTLAKRLEEIVHATILKYKEIYARVNFFDNYIITFQNNPAGGFSTLISILQLLHPETTEFFELITNDINVSEFSTKKKDNKNISLHS